MNREIEFRGKRVDNGEWVYGDLTGGDTIHTKAPWVDSGTYEWWGYEVIEESVGQYTGLKDKDGKKIFDGDVIKWERSYSFGDDYSNEPIDIDRTTTIVGEIYFNPLKGWKIRGKETRSNDIDGGFLSKDVNWNHPIPSMFQKLSEVIGNIHDNS
jgi:uncharacterized phage protein (TIGR01671 family)